MKKSSIPSLLLILVIFTTSACSPAVPTISINSNPPLQNPLSSATAGPDILETLTPPVQTMENPTVTAPQTSATPTPPEQNPGGGPTPTSPPLMNELQFPIRAAFYYPWFPEAWKQQGMNPFTHYQPGLGYYNQDDLSVIQSQITAMQYGKIQAGIASWWGQGTPTAMRMPKLLKLGEQMGFYWAVYAESEGVGNPSVSTIRSDLQYIYDNYAVSPAYLKIGGRFVVFVYSDPGDGCDMATRWTQANTVGAYLVLKDFPGYHKCSAQPDAWHQYAPAIAETHAQTDSYTISPGFWKGTEAKPRLPRDIEKWSNEIKAMIASNANFQLITTFNEWGEGTAVEDAVEWASSSLNGTYLDALHYDGSLSPN